MTQNLQLKGVLVALVTPFTADGAEIDVEPSTPTSTGSSRPACTARYLAAALASHCADRRGAQAAHRGVRQGCKRAVASRRRHRSPVDR